MHIIIVMRRDVFNAIADPTRRNILFSLRNEAKNINSLAQQFDITRQAVSLHIKYLDECGVIDIQKEGRERVCSIKPKQLKKIDDWLIPFKELWNARLDRMEDYLQSIKNNNNK